MNETLLWLFYCVSGVVAFAATHRARWHVALAVAAGGLVTLIGWLLLFRFTDEAQRPVWVRLDLALNVTLGLIFAAIGAASGWWMLRRRGRIDH